MNARRRIFNPMTTLASEDLSSSPSASRDFHVYLINLAVEAYDRAEGDRARFELEISERMAQAAQVYAMDVLP